MLNDLPRNTRITLLLEPYSLVLACILLFYGTLCMQAHGLGARQIGLIAAAGVAAWAVLRCRRGEGRAKDAPPPEAKGTT